MTALNLRPLSLLSIVSTLGCLVAFGGACSSSPSTPDAAVDGGLVGGGAWLPIAGGACGARERNVATLPSPHVEPDAGPVAWATNPPTSGPHYPVWARWGSWPDLPRGYWVHNLEHGGVAFLARCASGTCDPVRAELANATMAITDPACATQGTTVRARIIITNDREVSAAIAGAAWGWLYEASCVDAASLRSFYSRHAGGAPEDICADGFLP